MTVSSMARLGLITCSLATLVLIESAGPTANWLHAFIILQNYILLAAVRRAAAWIFAHEGKKDP